MAPPFSILNSQSSTAYRDDTDISYAELRFSMDSLGIQIFSPNCL
jgi:hypothetical protein